MPIQSILSKIGLNRRMYQIIELSLIGAGSLTLAWVASLTWTDIIEWNKDIGTIFFGSRAGENISLDIGMTVFNYFLISIALIGTGVVLFLRNKFLITKLATVKGIGTPKVKTTTQQQITKDFSEINKNTTEIKVDNAAVQEDRFFSGCLHHFGYLSSRPKESPIPQECILCQRLGDCMVATVYVNKISD